MDVHSPRVRSYNMSRIPGKDTKPEITVRRFLHIHGFRFRLHQKTLPGKPDIVLKKYRTVIFVNGCFWHGHKNCKYAKLPKTRMEWWREKIQKNINNDKKCIRLLKEKKWNVITVWGCKLKGKKLQNTLEGLVVKIRGENYFKFLKTHS